MTTGESDTMRHDGRREAEETRLSTNLNIQRQIQCCGIKKTNNASSLLGLDIIT